MTRKIIAVIILMFVLELLIISKNSEAMPLFARKYSADCSMCHTNVPQLNRVGYEFRLAGYRMPEDIGKDEKTFKLENFFTARIQNRLQVKDHNDDRAEKLNASKEATQGLQLNYTHGGLEFYEATLYPLTGAWGKNFGSLVELSMSSGDIFEVENAFVRGVCGNENGWLQAKIGVMHPWEGIGASDRPIANTRPLFQKAPSTGSIFYLWNLDESGFELGYNLAKIGTSIAARIGNGIIYNKDVPVTQPSQADPRQGGHLVPESDPLTNAKDANLYAGLNSPSYQIFINQFINDESAISLYVYQGQVKMPVNITKKRVAMLLQDDPTNKFADVTSSYTRIAGYANYYVVPNKINVLAGVEYGTDSFDDSSIASLLKIGDSLGYFGEIDYHVSDKLGFEAQYSFYDPSNQIDNNSIQQILVAVNYRVNDYFQVITDYIYKNTQSTTAGGSQGGNIVDNTLLANFILIF